VVVTEKDWLAAHPYLRPVAELHAIVGAALSKLPNGLCCVPSWHDYVSDFHAGVPLLRSSKSIVDLRPLEATIPSLIEKLGSGSLPEKLPEEIRGLAFDLGQIPEGSIGIMTRLLGQNAPTIPHWGLLRYLGWTAMAKYLSKVVTAFDSWRDEERWLRNYCPVCGSLPAMAQLIGSDPAKMRLLSCGCCGTRWRFRRTGCPFCENKNDHQLAALTIEGEAGLRIDFCESCSGYLKTYDGAGNEAVLLSDWTSLHLDVIAQDRGLKRLAASLYEV
jgi:FdhE protein